MPIIKSAGVLHFVSELKQCDNRTMLIDQRDQSLSEQRLAHRPDVLGVLCVPVLAWFVTRPTGSVYAGVFLATSVLELVGTGLGVWTWAATVPVIHLPSANPPAAIAAAYCAMDFTSSKIVGWLSTKGSRLRTLNRGIWAPTFRTRQVKNALTQAADADTLCT